MPTRHPPPPYSTSPVHDAKFRDDSRGVRHLVPHSTGHDPQTTHRPDETPQVRLGQLQVARLLRPGNKMTSRMMAARNVVKGSSTALPRFYFLFIIAKKVPGIGK
ncbi:uncharacterized protein LY79DRAFT_580095 [Colletotrichum navitas]|uniref:Uncharacterized protein n=1 Tax=Colletotrichum navitas TaxID=681940 RepID=A0AAD8V5D4_9PEZI|nr:uncharacterized protein LY79DRAFT_580095 [Colletotrichum navitas]KAK1590133.1 hypothetical protein LY79DRAFT_580095 [Colletotrichum navitas]